MPFHALEITTNHQNFIQTLQQNWRNTITVEEFEQVLSKMFPGANMANLYDLHYRFPRGSYVGIKEDNPIRYSVDTYSTSNVDNCISDFLSVLQRINDLNIHFNISNNRFGYEELNLQEILKKILITGRGFVFIFPPSISYIIDLLISSSTPSFNLNTWISYAITFIIYSYLYYKHEINRSR